MKAILDLMEKRKNRKFEAVIDEYLDDPYSVSGWPQSVATSNRVKDIPAAEELQLEEEVQPEVRKNAQILDVRAEKPQRTKELPESAFFNTPENPPTLKEKMTDKAKKVLWNK